MQSVAERLAGLPSDERAAILGSLSDEEAESLLYDWSFWARPEQIAPDGDWSVWLIKSGRGFGKTRAGAEWVRSQVKAGARRIALVGETAADCRDVMVEGESGILAVHPPDERPTYEPSKRRLTWPNGAIATLYNATEPDQLRGPEHEIAWCDELAKWRYPDETFAQLEMGLRSVGVPPRIVVTTTPRPIRIIRDMVSGAIGGVVVTSGSTLDNAANLPPRFIDRILERHGSTRLGRQEIYGEIVEDVAGALWTHDMIEGARVSAYPELQRVVVGVDPSGAGDDGDGVHDNVGVVVVGLGHDGVAYVLDDASTGGGPSEWGKAVARAYSRWRADRIVAERNFGGGMIEFVIRSALPGVSVKMVTASRGKMLRAEPVAALHEGGRLKMVGAFPELEDEMRMCSLSGYQGGGSPDRLDAMVFAVTELLPQMTQDFDEPEILVADVRWR